MALALVSFTLRPLEERISRIEQRTRDGRFVFPGKRKVLGSLRADKLWWRGAEFTLVAGGTLQWGYGDWFHRWAHGRGWGDCGWR